MKTLLESAISYFQKGYSTIPVGPDKRPLVPWKEFQEQWASLEQIAGWFTAFPEAQVGIVTGKVSNLTVVDIEAGGDFSIIEDETFTVQTGGQGRHYYFQYDSDFKTGARILPLIDIRSEGGYVVAPPSVTQKGAYSVLKDVPVAKMSEKTKQRLLGANTENSPHEKDLIIWDSPVGGGNQQEFKKFDISSAMNISKGGRNEALHKLAVSLLNYHNQSEVWQLVIGANMTYSPPLPEGEVRTLFNSALKFVKENPKIESANGKKETVWGPASQKQSILPAKEPGVISPDVEKDGEIRILHASEVAALQTIDTTTVYHTDMAPFDDALLGGFSAGDVIAVAGKSGVGKTTLTQDWTVTLATGGKAGQAQLPALWFSYEVLARPLWGKFETMGANPQVPIYLPTHNESGDFEWVSKMIEKGIAERGIKVVAIDHLGFLRPPRGNYANQADAIVHTVRSLKMLTVKHGLITLLPVHVRKGSGKVPQLEDIKDSSGIYQEADTVFFIDRVKGDDGLPTQQASIWLVKNRKTGVAANAFLDYEFGRYFYNEATNKIIKEGEKAVRDFDDID